MRLSKAFQVITVRLSYTVLNVLSGSVHISLIPVFTVVFDTLAHKRHTRVSQKTMWLTDKASWFWKFIVNIHFDDKKPQ